MNVTLIAIEEIRIDVDEYRETERSYSVEACPYCKSVNVEFYDESHAITHVPMIAVMCGNCQARGPIRMAYQDAVEMWNAVKR